ncbi:hypothetical protein MP638_006435 [Amoeboaphelidium occidentale]|nr:hypothetical protein MP638_006435 [Amoeboaphelidium occidentale]
METPQHSPKSRLQLSPLIGGSSSPLVQGNAALTKTSDVSALGVFDLPQASKRLDAKNSSTKKTKRIPLNTFGQMVLHVLVPCQHLNDFICIKQFSEPYNFISSKSINYPIESFLTNRHNPDNRKDHPLLEYSKKDTAGKSLWKNPKQWLNSPLNANDSQFGQIFDEAQDSIMDLNPDFLLILSRAEREHPEVTRSLWT